jgi:hypothetical protein
MYRAVLAKFTLLQISLRLQLERAFKYTLKRQNRFRTTAFSVSPREFVYSVEAKPFLGVICKPSTTSANIQVPIQMEWATKYQDRYIKGDTWTVPQQP